MGSAIYRALTIIILGAMFSTSIYVLNSTYNQKIQQINTIGRYNIETAIIWQAGNSIIESGIADDISQFTVDYIYLGDYPYGNGLQNYRNFRNEILADYKGLSNITEILNTSYAVFIDDKLIFIDGGTVKYTPGNAPYRLVAVYSPIFLFFTILPNWKLYVVYRLPNGKFYDKKYGYIQSATKVSNVSSGYCIYVEGTKANGTICYKQKINLPYIVETQHKWGGYNFTVYWGEVRG